MLLCDWLVALEEEESARMFQSVLYETPEAQLQGRGAAPLSPDQVRRLLGGLQRLYAQRRAQACGRLRRRHRAFVCETLARHLVSEAAPLSRLTAAAAAWEWRSLDGLLRAGRRHLLPPLVVAMATEGRADLLDAAAAVLKTKPKDLLIDNYQFVMSHLVLAGRRADLSRVHAFVASATGVQIQEIRRCSVQGQVNELLLGLHSCRDDVIRELGCLVRLERGGEPADQPVPLDDVIRYVSGRLLGVLGWADTKLGSPSTSDEEKRRLLLSIADLCQLLGGAAQMV
ncbi:uncharacterized protein LOC119104388 [Pollicipes pollicipes]|uniref:uncharacterized protein LOC119104388 n=1 Tax=Pollicipes pollicipes TaxID=41117 RepID=UPI001885728B|nr:uncharacterized protein LOC119104388 [Pollicipes pollicipes]